MAFAISDVNRLWVYYTRMFPFLGKTNGLIMTHDYVKYLEEYGPLLLLAAFFATPIPQVIYNRLKRKKGSKVLLNLIILVILWVSLYYLAISTNNPFLYFNF